MISVTAARKDGKGGMITCLAPDVCMTPAGNSSVPIPYMITSQLSFSVRTSQDVEFTGQQAFNMDSRTDKVIGDEPGTIGGVMSGVNRGYCRPKSNHMTVQVNGHQLLQSFNLFEMNCAGPEGSMNTIGMLIYSE